ncbi:MAG: glycosyltransferase family 2 protein [Fidelibacterota bacterium]
MSPQSSRSFVSVVIRSLNRLPNVLEIIEVCLEQDYDEFEVVVVDQSDEGNWMKYGASFEGLDSRVSVVRSEPLGPSGARNMGVSNSKGDLVLFIDDDDLPIGQDWISCHARHYKDPLCVGVSGRYVHRSKEPVRYRRRDLAYRRCLSYSFFLRGWDYTGIDRVKQPVEWLHGSNASVRKSYVVRAGGWYPYLSDFEEHSFAFALRRVMKPGEYLMFDPRPETVRRYNVPGGLERRRAPLSRLVRHHLEYYHWVVSKYFPFRFYLLYPLFMIHVFRFSRRWFLRYSRQKDNAWIRLFGKKYGMRLYILFELVKFPFSVASFVFRKRPKWSGSLT